MTKLAISVPPVGAAEPSSRARFLLVFLCPLLHRATASSFAPPHLRLLPSRRPAAFVAGQRRPPRRSSSPPSRAPAPTTTTTTTAFASRQICTFDESDFPDTEWPYGDSDLARLDSADDGVFYDEPRFVTHIDDKAIESLTAYYKEEFESLLMSANDGKGGKKKKKKKRKKLDILDLCSSWISHLPTEMESNYGRVAAVGMNERELAKNAQLTEFHVHDLNREPSMREYFDDDSFDVVCNVVSVDYLSRPMEVFAEMHRVLRPGGIALVSFSNRCFASKAVSMWLRADEIGRLAIVGSYFHYGDGGSGGGWTGGIEALDIKPPPLEAPKRPSVGDILNDYTKAFAWATTVGSVAQSNSGDPMYVVRAVK